MISARSALQFQEEIDMLKHSLESERRDSGNAEMLLYQVVGVSLIAIAALAYLWWDQHREATELRAELAVAVVEGCP